MDLIAIQIVVTAAVLIAHWYQVVAELLTRPR